MNCKPGDLAIVVKSKISSNVGLIVQVIGPHSPLDTGIITCDTSRHMWHCESQGSPIAWELEHSIGTLRRRNGPIPDECLQPIRDDEDDQDVHDSANVPHTGVVYAQQTECC